MKPTAPEKNRPARILLVDDKPENLRLLAEMLAEKSYTIQIARSGEQALRVADERLPDLILLDVNMPGLDGFEVCRRLRTNPATESVPVIFVTALAKTEEKVRGLELGGVDYITKPFQLEEVSARLETQLELKRLRDELAEKVADLKDRNGRLSLFAKALAHDLRGPLGVVMGFSQLLLMSDDLGEPEQEQAGAILEGSNRMNDIIESLLILAVADRTGEHLVPTSVEDSFRGAVDGLAAMISESGTRIHVETPLPSAPANGQWLERVWTNFLTNAIKYGGKPPLILVGAEEIAGGAIRYWVEDNGPGLDAKQKASLFTAFSRLHPEKAEGIGLGLVIVQKVVEQMRGQVGVEDGHSGGSRFFFTLPASGPEKEGRALAPGRFCPAEDDLALPG